MNKQTPSQIIRVLENPHKNRISIVEQISKNSSTGDLVDALQKSTVKLTRQILCDILGKRQEKIAVPQLLKCLDDTSSGVRASAADALGKIGDIRAGKELLKHFDKLEQDNEVRQILAITLGALKYKPAITSLIDGLDSDDITLRGCIAWSLGMLNAKEAKAHLYKALENTPGNDKYTIDRIEEALKIIDK